VDLAVWTLAGQMIGIQEDLEAQGHPAIGGSRGSEAPADQQGPVVDSWVSGPLFDEVANDLAHCQDVDAQWPRDLRDLARQRPSHMEERRVGDLCQRVSDGPHIRRQAVIAVHLTPPLPRTPSCEEHLGPAWIPMFRRSPEKLARYYLYR